VVGCTVATKSSGAERSTSAGTPATLF
jgi:hypothetical protein